MFVVLVVYQGCMSHILSMPFMNWPKAFGNPIATWCNTNNLTLSNDGGKYLTSHTSMLSKSIIITWSNLDMFLDFVSFNVSTKCQTQKGKKNVQRWTTRWSSLANQPHVRSLQRYLSTSTKTLEGACITLLNERWCSRKFNCWTNFIVRIKQHDTIVLVGLQFNIDNYWNLDH